MDVFVRFNRKSIDDRQIDTLIGIGKSLIVKGKAKRLPLLGLTWIPPYLV